MNEAELVTAIATKGIEVVGEKLYDDAVQPPAQAAGHALGTLMNVFNVLFAPLERAHIRSEAKTERLRRELEKGFEEIPEENRVEPPLEVVGPAMEVLKYVTDETLQDMFVKLLLSSMDSKKQPATHPAFVKIINELSPYDASLLKELFGNKYKIAAKAWGASQQVPVLLCKQGFDTAIDASTSLDNLLRLKLIKLNRIEKDDFIAIIMEDKTSVDEFFAVLNKEIGMLDKAFAIDIKNELSADECSIKYELKSFLSQMNNTDSSQIDKTYLEVFHELYEPTYIRITYFGINFCTTCIK